MGSGASAEAGSRTASAGRSVAALSES